MAQKLSKLTSRHSGTKINAKKKHGDLYEQRKITPTRKLQYYDQKR